MEKIKDITKVILEPGFMLAEMIEPKKKLIISPDGADSPDAYGKVVVAHEDVKDIGPGDLLIKISGNVYGWPVKQPDGKEKKFIMIHRAAVQIAVHPDNFINPDEVSSRVSL